jgi:DNA-binding transcriptional ArsR family regulator
MERNMSPFALNLERTKTETIQVALDPASNGFSSLLLIAKDERDPGIHDWVERTRSQMSAEELARHKLVLIGLFYAVSTRTGSISFPAYLSDLEQTPPSVFRETLLDSYAKIYKGDCTPAEKAIPVNWQEVLASPAQYVNFLKTRFGEEHVDEEVETRAYHYVIDPVAMKQLIVGHMRWMWTNHLEREWTRVRPMLEESVRAFNKVDYSDMTRLEAARFITGQELDDTKWVDLLEAAQTITFIPNAHIGPYIHKSHDSRAHDNLYVYFGARQPDGTGDRIPELDRAEIVAKLSALADETRLHILQMIGEKGQMRSQEIMETTSLSQPSVSRYLSQLTAAGYLQERRENGAKVYILNTDRLEKTLKAVNAFLLGRS